MPKYFEQYLHRAGRTGRLNRSGKVITFTDAADTTSIDHSSGSSSSSKSNSNFSENESPQDFVLKRYSNELGIKIMKRNLKIKPVSSK